MLVDLGLSVSVAPTDKHAEVIYGGGSSIGRSGSYLTTSSKCKGVGFLIMYHVNYIPHNLLTEQVRDERYENSSLVHVRNLAPKQKGARIEKIIEALLTQSGHIVEAPKSTDYDRIINHSKTEIKGSFLNLGKSVFSFLQIRPDQNYDQIMFCMFYPDSVILMTMEKYIVRSLCDSNIFRKQHGGSKAESGTFAFYGNEKDLEKLGAKYFI